MYFLFVHTRSLILCSSLMNFYMLPYRADYIFILFFEEATISSRLALLHVLCG
nr:MAG TPA: hypothetical protein [Caudoviricetes sp.]DAO00749.1 MAG TPA: hypothetical protein [Caudoviricetes sp.]